MTYLSIFQTDARLVREKSKPNLVADSSLRRHQSGRPTLPVIRPERPSKSTCAPRPSATLLEISFEADDRRRREGRHLLETADHAIGVSGGADCTFEPALALALHVSETDATIVCDAGHPALLRGHVPPIGPT